ncbi:TrpB-like pyridoxal phosphate-dependent enzyme [Miltoncostaea marina]|uniref:TrpB-like pyridoxal phosphate-dependent enzyme n=1 Tax=Miltoncostaea marina TaxID=2843215 RepID=UPI001C3C4A4F|nr:TrpB-like pyridoxal phosphate-dependent enzyme [Miltoncostaea marina]
MSQRRYLLDEGSVPTRWYNVAADLPSLPPPPLHPGTGQPVGPDDLAPIFPMSLIEQEVSTERWIPIPDPVREVYAMWRPTPLHRAVGLERALGTPCRIFYKYEGVSPAGSHKPNTSVAQAYYNREEGVRRLSTETGAGQWGSALAFACTHFGIECKVYMVRASYDSKPYRRSMIHTWGGEVVASPSPDTAAGRAILAETPDSTGSLGMAISEAVEDAATRDDTNYSLGSVLNHVLLHQTVVGQEAREQLAQAGAEPDVIIGCVGGGSNFAGLVFPFLADAAAGRPLRIIAAEPAACPTLTRGHYGYDFGDTAGMTPLLAMHTLGRGFVPAAIHSGGLRYHGMAPLVSHLVETGIVEARAYQQRECFAEAVRFARAEGIIPGPEPSHAIRAVVEEVERAREEGVERTILFNLSGHGNFDMAAYDAYLSGEMIDYELPQEELDAAAADLEGLPALP